LLQYLLQQGDYCKSFTFVSKGLLKSYNIDDKGNEHISVFAWEGWWVSDMPSFFSGKEASLNIEAVESSELLTITLANYNLLLEQVPIMERYFRMLYQNSLLTKDLRLMSAATHTAEEKYTNLVRSHPELVQRVPQNLIASYLGLAAETISRIKKKLSHTH
ncbi:MAG: Crp/Fnr family transcriptional regulator, partial [Pedobacter sp.]